MKCPYCGGKANLVPASTVYKSKKFRKGKLKLWVCENYPECDSYVGCHPGTEIPLGRLANEKLRNLKMEAHKQFDPIWKSGLMSRKDAYKWLASMLDIDESECHIGMFNPDMCNKVIQICRRQDNPEIQEYRLKQYGYEQKEPMFTRGYNHNKRKP